MNDRVEALQISIKLDQRTKQREEITYICASRNHFLNEFQFLRNSQFFELAVNSVTFAFASNGLLLIDVRPKNETASTQSLIPFKDIRSQTASKLRSICQSPIGGNNDTINICQSVDSRRNIPKS